jgi:phospholipase A1
MPLPRASPLACGFFVLAAVTAQGADLADCKRIDAPAARLACYDALSGRVDGTAVPPQGPDAAGSAPAVPADKHAVEATPARGAPPRETPAPAVPSMIGERWALDAAPRDTRYNLVYHNANYFIGRYTNRVNANPSSPTHPPGTDVDTPHLNPGEAKFQLSFKARLWEDPERRVTLWAAYTQQSHWQIGNTQLSRPFRETDFQPEVIVTFRTDLKAAGFRWRLVNLGLVHQSNGREDPLSRSWNRVYAQFGIEHGDFALLLRPWHRFPESYNRDDNPDIHRYYGGGDLTMLYRRNGFTYTLMARANAGTGKGALELAWSTPPLLGPIKLYVQAFTGYGESLIDYNWRQNTIGAGISLNDLL